MSILLLALILTLQLFFLLIILISILWARLSKYFFQLCLIAFKVLHNFKSRYFLIFLILYIWSASFLHPYSNVIVWLGSHSLRQGYIAKTLLSPAAHLKLLRLFNLSSWTKEIRQYCSCWILTLLGRVFFGFVFGFELPLWLEHNITDSMLRL